MIKHPQVVAAIAGAGQTGMTQSTAVDRQVNDDKPEYFC